MISLSQESLCRKARIWIGENLTEITLVWGRVKPGFRIAPSDEKKSSNQTYKSTNGEGMGKPESKCVQYAIPDCWFAQRRKVVYFCEAFVNVNLPSYFLILRGQGYFDEASFKCSEQFHTLSLFRHSEKAVHKNHAFSISFFASPKYLVSISPKSMFLNLNVCQPWLWFQLLVVM